MHQKLPPPPPWVDPEEDVCVLLPSESESLAFGFAVRVTVLYRNISRLSVIFILPAFI